MAKFRTLETIEAEIAEGKLGIAKDRLQGLITSYPADVSLRSRLGGVYAMLGYSVLAGRYWYLDEDPDERKRVAIGAFDESCKRNPAMILHRLKLRCDPQQLSTPHARTRVDRLIADCKTLGIEPPTFERNSPAPQAAPARSWDWVWLACFLIGVIFLAGLVKIIEWFAALLGW